MKFPSKGHQNQQRAKNSHLDQLGGVGANTGALLDDLNGEGEVLKHGSVHSGNSAAEGALLALNLVCLGGLLQDSVV